MKQFRTLLYFEHTLIIWKPLVNYSEIELGYEFLKKKKGKIICKKSSKVSWVYFMISFPLPVLFSFLCAPASHKWREFYLGVIRGFDSSGNKISGAFRVVSVFLIGIMAHSELCQLNLPKNNLALVGALMHTLCAISNRTANPPRISIKYYYRRPRCCNPWSETCLMGELWGNTHQKDKFLRFHGKDERPSCTHA